VRGRVGLSSAEDTTLSLAAICKAGMSLFILSEREGACSPPLDSARGGPIPPYGRDPEPVEGPPEARPPTCPPLPARAGLAAVRLSSGGHAEEPGHEERPQANRREESHRYPHFRAEWKRRP